MRTTILLTLAAGLFSSVASAQGNFDDAVTFSLHHIKGDSTHFKTTVGNNLVTERTADKTVRGVYWIAGIDQPIEFEWSPDTGRIPIQACTAWLSADPNLANVKWDLDDGAGAAKPAAGQNPKRLPVTGSTHVECKPLL